MYKGQSENACHIQGIKNSKNLNSVSTCDNHFHFGPHTLTLTNDIITPINGEDQITNKCTYKDRFKKEFMYKD